MVVRPGDSEPEPWAEVLERVRVAAERYRVAQDAADDERELRDRAIVDAMELGAPYREVASAAGISTSRVAGILARH